MVEIKGTTQQPKRRLQEPKLQPEIQIANAFKMGKKKQQLEASELYGRKLRGRHKKWGKGGKKWER